VIGNACGTIGLLHAVANNDQKLELDADKFFAKFLGQTRKMDLMERAVALEANSDIEVGTFSTNSDNLFPLIW